MDELDKLSNSTQADIENIAAELKQYSDYINDRHNLRYQDLQTSLEECRQSLHTIEAQQTERNTTIEEKFTKIYEDLQTIEDFSNGIEDIVSGESIPRPFIRENSSGCDRKITQLPLFPTTHRQQFAT